MRIRIKRDLTSGLFLMAASAVLWFVIPIHITGTGEIVKGARLFPRIILAAMFCLSAIITLKALAGKTDRYMEFDWGREWKILLYAAGIILYVLILGLTGFIIASLLFAMVTLRIFRAEWTGYLFMALFVLAVYLLFTFVLGINLP